MATETIREFLVKLGFKQDEAGLKKFSDGISQATSAVFGLAAAVEGTATLVAVGVERFAANLAALYYEARRTGTSARELKALDIAAQNLGANAGEAESAVEGMAKALRETPGLSGTLEGILKQYGLTVKRMANGQIDATDAVLKFVQATRTAGPNLFFYMERLGGLFNFQADTLNKLVQGDLLNEYNRALAKLGPGFEDAARNAAKFEIQWRLIKLQFESIGADVFNNIAKAFGFKDLEDFDKWLETHHKLIVERITWAIGEIVKAAKWLIDEIRSVIRTLEDWDKETDGLSTKLIAIAAVLKVSGAGSLIAGIIQFGGALASLAVAAGPAVPVLAAIAASVTAIYSAWQAMHGESADNWISDLANWTTKKLTGGRETSFGGWLHDKLTPLGLRLNNPGNLKFAGQAGAALGEKGFAQFATPETGLLAMGRQLELYGRRGINTIADIIAMYDPEPNKIPAYIRDVMQHTGFGANERLNLADPNTLARLMDAMIFHEQGVNPFSAQQVGAAAHANIAVESTINVNGVQDPKKVAEAVQEQFKKDLATATRAVVPRVR